MIIRRATQAVAGTTMSRSATRWLPKAWPEGPREAGIGQRRRCRTAPEYTWWAPTARYGDAFPLEETAPPCAVSPDFTATRMGRGFAGGLSCQIPGEGNRPFASVLFAHPIPQSRRRASGDLFSASLSKFRTSGAFFQVHLGQNTCSAHIARLFRT